MANGVGGLKRIDWVEEAMQCSDLTPSATNRVCVCVCVCVCVYVDIYVCMLLFSCSVISDSL